MVIKGMNNQTTTMMQNANDKREENENMLFCKSLVPVLDTLSPRDNVLAKCKSKKSCFI